MIALDSDVSGHISVTIVHLNFKTQSCGIFVPVCATAASLERRSCLQVDLAAFLQLLLGLHRIPKAAMWLCGECCPLPTSATGLYKFLVQALILGLLYATLQMASLAAVLPGPVSLVVGILSVTILIYGILITVIVCKSKNEAWMQPMYSTILPCVIINLVMELVLFIFGIFQILLAYIPGEFVANVRLLRGLRMLRLLPLVEIVCWVVCICKVRPLAASSAPVLKSDAHGPKVKASQRKALERKVAKACAPPPPPPQPLAPPPLFAKVEPSVTSVMGLLTSFKVTLGGSDTAMYIAYDSVVKFTGDAIVNAANEGCLGGGGIDGEIGRRGGETLYAARHALPVLDGGRRCPTGDAKITVAGDLPCSKVIHAVGPTFGYSPCVADHADKLELLEGAYKNSMERARENELKSVGFCILSAGIFRGGCPLKVVIETGLMTIAKNTYPGLETVVFCGFTPQEQAELDGFAARVA
jgi:O-acetyl-ADP-ribose deacetylase (regulator of RNase III)